ncbi:MAG: DUF2085 domain-containing protein [Halobacteriales archaeon]
MPSHRSEVRVGLVETRRYLLSHHEPEEWDRCHAVGIPGKERPVRICARCSGIYPGIALGVALVWARALPVVPALVAVLPAFALLDWGRSQFTAQRGSNTARTVTGFGLGFGYGMGLLGVLRGDARIAIILVGVGYASLAAAALWAERRLR